MNRGKTIRMYESRGDFTLPDSWGMLSELRTILSALTVTAAHFSANHASNFLPIKGDLPGDKERLLTLVDRVLDSHDDGLLRPDWRRGL